MSTSAVWDVATGATGSIESPGDRAAATTPLTVAVAQPACVATDVAHNVGVHADVVREADARVVVFPELSLTGYELCAAPPVDPADRVFDPLINACTERRSLALVGAPVLERDRSFIAMLAVTGTGVTVVYRKMFPGSDETARFAAGDTTVALLVDGWRLGVGICRDTAVPRHLSAVASLDVDAYVASLVMHQNEKTEQDARACRIAQALRVPVAFASFAGPTGSGYADTAGHSGIWTADGTPVAHASGHPGHTVRATLHPRQKQR